MSLKKQFLKSKPVCKVTFKVPREAVDNVGEVFLVGDFNGWSEAATPMKRLKDGSFSVTLDLETGHDYQYRFLMDGEVWENDGAADDYVRSDFGDCDNSVVSV